MTYRLQLRSYSFVVSVVVYLLSVAILIVGLGTAATFCFLFLACTELKIGKMLTIDFWLQSNSCKIRLRKNQWFGYLAYRRRVDVFSMTLWSNVDATERCTKLPQTEANLRTSR